MGYIIEKEKAPPKGGGPNLSNLPENDSSHLFSRQVP